MHRRRRRYPKSTQAFVYLLSMLDKTFRTKRKEKKKSSHSQKERKKRQKGPGSQLETPAAVPEVGRTGGRKGVAAEAAEK